MNLLPATFASVQVGDVVRVPGRPPRDASAVTAKKVTDTAITLTLATMALTGAPDDLVYVVTDA